ncbi:MAG: hypothetical protein IPF99_30500 [Deltaproteobacteria bacterium]|nr:hypothetical protein [Deltaproteobacteria bacterium]
MTTTAVRATTKPGSTATPARRSRGMAPMRAAVTRKIGSTGERSARSRSESMRAPK